MAVQLLDQMVEPHEVFDREDDLQDAHHEMVVHFAEVETGLRAIVRVHDTTLGPALGGARFFPYRSEAEALTNSLRLSRGMTFEAAAAGMHLGGGKAFIIGDLAGLNTPALLRAYGRSLDRLGGTYITAADVGTTSADFDVIGEITRHVVGRTKGAGGSGDSGFATVYGVFCFMQAAATAAWGSAGLCGRTVGIERVGKGGIHLTGLLLDEGAIVVIADLSELALRRVAEAYDGVSAAASASLAAQGLVEQRLQEGRATHV